RWFVDEVADFKRNASTMKVQRLLQLIKGNDTQGAIKFMEKMESLKAGKTHLSRPREESFIEWSYPISKIGKLIKGDIDEEEFQDQVGEIENKDSSKNADTSFSLYEEKKRLAALLNIQSDQIEITIKF
ncbi:MAG: hypothetical protein AAFR74_07250, partial [Pseudomonadota bacterium]